MPVRKQSVHYESGVYRILNKGNDKRYIGSTEGTFKGRRINHRSDLNKRKHVNRFNVHLPWSSSQLARLIT